MAEPPYVSEIRIERRYGPVRIAFLPAEKQPVVFGVHGEVAAHCGVDLSRFVPSRASTLDYIVAATGASLVGAFGNELEERKIDASHGRLTADVRGQINAEQDGTLMIRKIEIQHRLVASEAERLTIDRVHASYMTKCPVFRTLHSCVEILSSYEILPEAS